MESLEDLRKRLLGEERVQQMVRVRAYEIFQMRGGQPGWEANDWFQAEGEVLAFLIALESREDETTQSETAPAVFVPKAPSVSDVPAIRTVPVTGAMSAPKTSSSSQASVIGKPAKAPAAKKPSSGSASRTTTAKPGKTTAPKPAASRKSDSRPKDRTRKSKQEENN